MVISLEQNLPFQPGQHKLHLHIHMSVVSEISAGYPKGRDLQKWGQRWALRWKRGFKGKPVLQKNHSLGAYRYITLRQGTVNGRLLFFLTQGLVAPKEIIRVKTTKDFTFHTGQGYSVVLTTTVGCRE